MAKLRRPSRRSPTSIKLRNKLDLYDNGDKARLINYAKRQGQAHVNVIFAKHGKIELSALQGSIASLPSQLHHHHNHQLKSLAADSIIPECGYIKAVNEGEGFSSVGWRFSPDKVFNREKLFLLLTGVLAERIKAVFITDIGIFGYNATPDALNEIELDDCFESRIEIISESIDDSLEILLLECIEL